MHSHLKRTLADSMAEIAELTKTGGTIKDVQDVIRRLPDLDKRTRITRLNRTIQAASNELVLLSSELAGGTK